MKNCEFCQFWCAFYILCFVLICRLSYVTPSGIVSGIKAVHPMFRGYTQQVGVLCVCVMGPPPTPSLQSLFCGPDLTSYMVPGTLWTRNLNLNLYSSCLLDKFLFWINFSKVQCRSHEKKTLVANFRVLRNFFYGPNKTLLFLCVS
jgi:hypothetical protein